MNWDEEYDSGWTDDEYDFMKGWKPAGYPTDNPYDELDLYQELQLLLFNIIKI